MLYELAYTKDQFKQIFDIQHQFQLSMPCPNDMNQTKVTKICNNLGNFLQFLVNLSCVRVSFMYSFIFVPRQFDETVF